MKQKRLLKFICISAMILAFFILSERDIPARENKAISYKAERKGVREWYWFRGKTYEAMAGMARGHDVAGSRNTSGAAGNTPPVINPIGNQSGSTSEPFRVTPMEVLDSDDDPNTTATVILDATGFPVPFNTIWFPNAAASTPGYLKGQIWWSNPIAGTYTVVFTATDEDGATDTETITVTITGSGGNIPPVINPIGNQSGSTSEPFRVTPMEVLDSDDDPNTTATVILDATGFPVPFNTIWFPNAAASTPGYLKGQIWWSNPIAGTYTVTFTATDESGATDTETITVTIAGTNLPPVINPIGNQNGSASEPFRVIPMEVLDFDDVPGTVRTVALEATGFPVPWNTIWFVNQAASTPGYLKGKIWWTRPIPGTYTVTFTATDEDGATDTETITVTIADDGDNIPPVINPIGDQTGETGQTFRVNPVEVLDLDDDPNTTPTITLDATGFSVPWQNIWLVNGGASEPGYLRGQIYWQNPVEGTYTVTLTATDESGATDTETITVTIINSPPELTFIGDRSGVPGATFTIDPVEISNSDGDTLSLIATGFPVPWNTIWHVTEHMAGSLKGYVEWDNAVAGTYTVTFTAIDQRGATDTETIKVVIAPSGAPPYLGSVSPDPDSGKSIPGHTVYFTATYADPDGWNNIDHAYINISTSGNTANSCYAAYDRGNNQVSLRNDSDTGWSTGTIGSATVLENGQVRLICSGTAVSGSINTTTVTWAIQFRKPYTGGPCNIYLRARDGLNQYSGPFEDKGDWKVLIVPKRAMWVWSMSDDLVLDSPAGSRTVFFNFCAAPHGNDDRSVTTVYLSGSVYGLDLVNDHAPQLRNFLADAHSRGLKVECLEGDPSWALPGSRINGETRCDEILAFNNSSPSDDERFDGLHFDVEPHGLRHDRGYLYDWHQDNAAIWSEYIALLECCQGEVDNYNTTHTDIKFSADIPCWYDSDSHPGTANEVQSRVDYVTIMDYRDSAARIISGAAQEIINGNTLGKDVVIGVETLEVPPPSITFYQEGNAYMEQQLGQTAIEFHDDAGFAGFSIHFYEDIAAGREAYRALKP